MWEVLWKEQNYGAKGAEAESQSQAGSTEGEWSNSLPRRSDAGTELWYHNVNISFHYTTIFIHG